MEQMIPYYNQSIHDALAFLNRVLPSELIAAAEDIAELLIPEFGDYGQEIASNAPKMGIPVGAAVLLNIFYEIEAGCTSIVSQDKQGNIIHGRNLDFSLAPVLRNLVINVQFQSQGKTIYYGVTYAGYVGLLTGLRPGAFSITINQRNEGNRFLNFLEALFIPGTRVLPFLIRDTLQDQSNFSAATQVLSTTSLAAPCYITVAGVQLWEGMVITRNRYNTADIWSLKDAGWYLAQTNDDHWKPDSDGRSTAAKNHLNQIGQANINFDSLFTVLSTPPVLAPSTTYTTLMSPQKSELITKIREL